LSTNQEEADTKIFLCCLHASRNRIQNICISTVDSDTAIYALYFNDKIDIHMFIQIGVGNKKRLLDIKGIATELGVSCCHALPSLHAFTGNYYTSAFHGMGKSKAFKLLKSSEEYLNAFSTFGDSFTFDVTLFPTLERFVCKLYGTKSDDTNSARYENFCSKKKTPEPQQLPPTRDALLCHVKRTSYATALVKSSLVRFPEVPSPDEHGWKLLDGDLSIVWMLRKPAFDEILELVNCNCKKSKCATHVCLCKMHGLNCTDLCSCGNCENSEKDTGDLSDHASDE